VLIFYIQKNKELIFSCFIFFLLFLFFLIPFLCSRERLFALALACGATPFLGNPNFLYTKIKAVCQAGRGLKKKGGGLALAWLLAWLLVCLPCLLACLRRAKKKNLSPACFDYFPPLARGIGFLFLFL
jgi:hypothetical protein